jgi:TIR domain
MGKKEEQEVNNLHPSYDRSKYQKCFIGHTHNASWRAVIIEVSDEVLPTFGLRPWYADAQFDPTTSLREKVVEMIKNTPYGIYDLSYWRANEQGSWQMPRNVLIELGMAIALNRPTLLLRHAENRIAGLALPDCLQSVEPSFCEFMGGKKSLRDALTTHLPHWVKRSPEQEWRNRYCLFGGMVCDYRKAHPLSPHVIQNKINCHIADGQDIDRDDFRASVEEIIERFDTIGYQYLDTCSLAHGYNFSLCSQCQLVRSTPFAIYRLTAHTPAETFITIGMSIALEKQFRYKIPKILLTDNLEHVPSLLTGYEVVIVRNDQEMRARLAQFLPQVIQRVQETTWRPQALPFEVHLPSKDVQIYEHNEALNGKDVLPTTHKQKEKEAIKLFYSYAHEDEAFREQLGKHLVILERRGLIASCYDGDIMPGTEGKQEIEAHLNSANIILLLISPDFIASDFCYSIEMKRALERHEEGAAQVIPILLRPISMDGLPIAHLQTLPKNGTPVARWRNRDAAYLDIVQGIKEAINKFVNKD